MNQLGDKIAILFIIATLSLSIAFTLTTVNDPFQTPGRKYSAIERAHLEFRRALTEVKRAETSNVNQSQLARMVEQLNLVLWMIDRSERLTRQGDLEGSVSQAERSIEVSRTIMSDAVKIIDTIPGVGDPKMIRYAAIGVSTSLLMIAALCLAKRIGYSN